MLQPPSLQSLVPQTHTLPNGNTLRYFPNSALGLVRLDITLEAGSRYQQWKSQAYIANRLFGEATAGRGANEVAEFLDFRGIILERTTDVCVGNLSFYFLRRYADELFALVRQMFDSPYSSEDVSPITPAMFAAAVAGRRQQLATSFQKTAYLARNHFYEILYGSSHPLGTYAKPEDMEHLTLDAVNHFIDCHYRLGSAHLLLSGCVDDDLLRLADQYLSPDRGEAVAELLLPPPAPTSGCSDNRTIGQPDNRAISNFNYQFSIPHAVQSTIRIGRILPMPWDSTDYACFLVLNTALGGYFGSRLMSNLREDKGYTYGIYSQSQIYRGNVVFYITADVAVEATQAAVDEVMSEIARLQHEPLPDDELARVRSYMMGDFIRSIDGVFEVSERYRQMAATHTGEQLTTNLLDAILHVTPAQLQTLAQTYLTNLVTVTVG